MQNKENTKGRVQLIVARVVAYAILIFLALLCLFSFYMLIINATRSNAQLQGGFAILPREHFLDNLKNAWTDASINIARGMLNSFLIAACFRRFGFRRGFRRFRCGFRRFACRFRRRIRRGRRHILDGRAAARRACHKRERHTGRDQCAEQFLHKSLPPS